MKKIVLALFTACAMLPASAQSEHNFEAAKNLDIFNALYKELDLYYVDTLDAQKLVRAAIDGMLDELDPYTEFYSAKTREDLNQMATGKYAGIGAIIQYNKKPIAASSATPSRVCRPLRPGCVPATSFCPSMAKIRECGATAMRAITPSR